MKYLLYLIIAILLLIGIIVILFFTLQWISFRNLSVSMPKVSFTSYDTITLSYKYSSSIFFPTRETIKDGCGGRNITMINTRNGSLAQNYRSSCLSIPYYSTVIIPPFGLIDEGKYSVKLTDSGGIMAYWGGSSEMDVMEVEKGENIINFKYKNKTYSFPIIIQ